MGLTGASDPDAVMRRRQQLADAVGFDLLTALMTVQEHGANIATFHRTQPQGGQCVFDTDALATDMPGQAIVTYHADCFPLLFFDGSRGVVAGAHAGWRGSLSGVATATVRELRTAYGTKPDEIEVLIGPGICARCYPVGEMHLDIAEVVRMQLEDEGVPSARIRSAGWCTREEDRWFSHRGGRPGRFLSVIVAP
jgi:polyphenol oxidase